MSNRLEQIVNDTLSWADDLSERWTGTMTGNIIDSQKDSLRESVESGDMKLASIRVLELAQTCDRAEEVVNEHETG